MALDIIRTAQRIHQRTLNSVAGEWVTYADGEFEIRLKMTRGGSEPSQMGDEEIHIEGQHDDWSMLAEDFENEGETITPRVGAVITPDAGDGTYEVVAGMSGRCYRNFGSRGVRLLIHTDHIEPDDA